MLPYDPVPWLTEQEGLAAVRPRQQRRGTFGRPCEVERVAAVLLAVNGLTRQGA